MGDVLTLIEKAEKELDQDKAREAAEKMAESRFTLEDFLTQMREVKKLGPLQDLLAMMPGMPGGGPQLKDLQVDERRAGAGRGDHLVDDAAGARPAASHQRQPPPADRARLGHHHPAGERRCSRSSPRPSG